MPSQFVPQASDRATIRPSLWLALVVHRPFPHHTRTAPSTSAYSDPSFSGLRVLDFLDLALIAVGAHVPLWNFHTPSPSHPFLLSQIHDPSHVAGRGPTLANWAGGAHPVTYSEADFTPAFLAGFQVSAMSSLGVRGITIIPVGLSRHLRYAFWEVLRPIPQME